MFSDERVRIRVVHERENTIRKILRNQTRVSIAKLY